MGRAAKLQSLFEPAMTDFTEQLRHNDIRGFHDSGDGEWDSERAADKFRGDDCLGVLKEISESIKKALEEYTEEEIRNQFEGKIW